MMKRIKEALAGIVKKAVFTVYLFTVIAPGGVYGQGRREGAHGVKREASTVVAQKVIGQEGGRIRGGRGTVCDSSRGGRRGNKDND